MKKILAFPIAALAFIFTGCSDDLESGKEYSALYLGDTTMVYKIDKVMQNDVDVKPYFEFFNDVELTLSYKNGEPSNLTFTESGVPFRVTSLIYDQLYTTEWEIYSAKAPYEIRKKGTTEVIGYITRDNMVTFSFQLGCESNKYQYQLRPVNNK